MTRTFVLISFLIIASATNMLAQDEDAIFIKKIHDAALSNGNAYRWLTTLCTKHGGRIAGSDAYLGATKYTAAVLKSIPGVSSRLQECEAMYWQRGNKEQVYIIGADGKRKKLDALALGNSVGTPSEGLTAEVIEVQSLDEVEKLGHEKIKGKIIF